VLDGSFDRAQIGQVDLEGCQQAVILPGVDDFRRLAFGPLRPCELSSGSQEETNSVLLT
jgi:hypothetical protein